MSGQLPEPASDVEPAGHAVGAVAPAPEVVFSAQKVPAGHRRVVLDACPGAHQYPGRHGVAAGVGPPEKVGQ